MKLAYEFNLPPRVTSSDPYSYHVSNVKGPSDDYMERKVKESDAHVLNFAKDNLARLEAGERTQGIPEHVAQDTMANLRKSIARMEIQCVRNTLERNLQNNLTKEK